MAAALIDPTGRILIAQRPPGVHQGGLWEFPGGKRESGESREQALARELEEELGIRILESRPLICIAHDYPEQGVLLDVWRVTRWQGRVRACENQPLTWVPVQELHEFSFPQADKPVLSALELPDRYLITPPSGPDPRAWLAGLEASLAQGISLVQIRDSNRSGRELETLVTEAVAVCRRQDTEIQVLVNTDPDLARGCGADGVHLNRQRLWAMSSSSRVADGQLLGASCHGAEDLRQALAVGADFAVLSPVAVTLSHPGAPVLGWPRFEKLLRGAAIPIYALGGMGAGDLATAIAAGGQGIAAIRGLWKQPGPSG